MRYIKLKDLALQQRKATSHKGENGRVLVIGGSEDYTGALALAGLAALRCGADYVVLAAPEKVAWAINCLTPDLITRKFRCAHFTLEHARPMISLAQGFDCVCIGNGLGRRSDAFVRHIARHIRIPMVIDADALHALRLQDLHRCILTPHSRELEALLANSGITEPEIPKHIGTNVILIKGRIDRIIFEQGTLYNRTGNPGMTKAGTGDVLAGLCAGFAAQGLNLVQSAVNAAYINGLAGDRLLRKRGWYTYLASDLLAEIDLITQKNINPIIQ